MPHTKAHTCNGCCGFRWREDSVRLLVTNATQLTKKKASISFQNNQHVRFIKTRSGQQRVGASCSPNAAVVGYIYILEQGSFNCGRDREHAQ